MTDFTSVIEDWVGSDLTEEEAVLLAELNEAKLIESPGRKIEGYTDEDRRRNKIFKTLVYKDRANFSIGKPGYFIFITRDGMGRI